MQCALLRCWVVARVTASVRRVNGVRGGYLSPGRYPFCYPQNASQPLFGFKTEAGDGDRTRTKSLEGSCAAITPRPRMILRSQDPSQLFGFSTIIWLN